MLVSVCSVCMCVCVCVCACVWSGVRVCGVVWYACTECMTAHCVWGCGVCVWGGVECTEYVCGLVRMYGVCVVLWRCV